MRMHRICAGALALLLFMGIIGGAVGEITVRRRAEVSALFHQAEERQSRHWWGVLYGDALLMARADEGEDLTEQGKEPVFVWPLWEWLLRFLGLR